MQGPGARKGPRPQAAPISQSWRRQRRSKTRPARPEQQRRSARRTARKRAQAGPRQRQIANPQEKKRGVRPHSRQRRKRGRNRSVPRAHTRPIPPAGRQAPWQPRRQHHRLTREEIAGRSRQGRWAEPGAHGTRSREGARKTPRLEERSKKSRNTGKQAQPGARKGLAKAVRGGAIKGRTSASAGILALRNTGGSGSRKEKDREAIRPGGLGWPEEAGTLRGILIGYGP
jgi:hypothetical protein